MKKTRNVLTRKQAMEKLTRVLKEVEKGNMSARRACAKHNFPLYKYTYWKKMKEESDALDAAIDEHEKEEGMEVLNDTSPLKFKEMKEYIKQLEGDLARVQERNADFGTRIIKQGQRIKKLEAYILDEVLDFKDKESNID